MSRRWAFLGVVLSDEPVAGMNTYYQRLVARDQDEAAIVVDKGLKTQTLAEVYDTVLLPALSYAKQDLLRDILTADEVRGIVQATQEIVEESGQPPAAAAPRGERRHRRRPPITSVSQSPHHGVSGPRRDRYARLADVPAGVRPLAPEVELLPVALPIADVVARVAQTLPALLCIGAVCTWGPGPHAVSL